MGLNQNAAAADDENFSNPTKLDRPMSKWEPTLRKEGGPVEESEVCLLIPSGGGCVARLITATATMPEVVDVVHFKKKAEFYLE